MGGIITAFAHAAAGAIADFVFRSTEDRTFPIRFTSGFPSVRAVIVLPSKDPSNFVPIRSLAKEIPNWEAFSKVGSRKVSAKSKEVPISGT